MNAFTRIRAAVRPLLLAAALLAASSPLAAQSARVLGRVTDGAGNAVAGARVTVAAADGTRRSTVSGRGGGFEFANLPAGTYVLRAEGTPRVGAREQRITVEAGQVISPVVRLLEDNRPQRGSARARPKQR